MSQPTEVPFGNATVKLLEGSQRESLNMHRRLVTDSGEETLHTGFAWGEEPVEEYMFLREVRARNTRHGDGTIRTRTISVNYATIRSWSEDAKASCVDIAGHSNNVTLSGKTKVCTLHGDDNSVTVPFKVPRVVVLSSGNTITLKGDRNVIVLSGDHNSVNWAGDEGHGQSEESKTSKGQLSGHLSGSGSGTSFEVGGPDSVITAPTERYLNGTQVFVNGGSNNILVSGEENLILDSSVGRSTNASDHFEGDPAVGPETFFGYEYRPRLKFCGELSGGDGDDSGGDDSSKADLTLGTLEAYFRLVTGRPIPNGGGRAWAEYAVEYATASSRVELNKLGVAPTVSSTGDVYTASLKNADFDMAVTVNWSAFSTQMDGAAAHARPDDHMEVEVGEGENTGVTLAIRPESVSHARPDDHMEVEVGEGENPGVTLAFRPASVEDAAEDDSDGGFDLV